MVKWPTRERPRSSASVWVKLFISTKMQVKCTFAYAGRAQYLHYATVLLDVFRRTRNVVDDVVLEHDGVGVRWIRSDRL